ncbi:hypothetical protein ACLK1S_09530 [Escherichia coli]
MRSYRGERNGETYPVQDDAHWLERYQQLWSQHRDRVIGTQELVAIVLAEKDHWEQDLTQVLVWSSRLLMTSMRFLKKGCAKLYVRCANNTVLLNPVSTGFLFHYISYNILCAFIINRCHMQRLLML